MRCWRTFCGNVEMFQLSSKSLLKNIPIYFPADEVIVLDGLRHAIEIACYAHNRLSGNLLRISSECKLKEGDVECVFLDAWAIVDAIDRFRSLLQLIYSPKFSWSLGSSIININKEFFNIRSLRNVADHLAQRVPYVVSKKGSALGILKWLAVRNFSVNTPLSEFVVSTYSIVPGTAYHPEFQFLLVDGGEPIDLPVGMIMLYAGEYSCDLNASIKKIIAASEGLESELYKHIEQSGKREHRVIGSDVFMKADLNCQVRSIFTSA